MSTAFELSSDAIDLLEGVVAKSGGRDKWSALAMAVRRVCKARDRQGIADFVRAAAKRDDGAVQFAMLALLGLSLSEELLRQLDQREDA